MSKEEMEAGRHASFGDRYRSIRETLDRSGSQEKKKEFREIEDTLLYLIPYILKHQDIDGLWNYPPYHKILTAHSVRLMHHIGLTLKGRWNLLFKLKGGNLFHATERLLEFLDPSKNKVWDVWDDSWILMALLEIESELGDEQIQKWYPHIDDKFQTILDDRVDLLQTQFNIRGFDEKAVKKKWVTKKWYGPAYFSAAIELFARLSERDRLSKRDEFPKANDNIKVLATAAEPLLRQSLDDAPGPPWEHLFGWHIGQFLVTWKENRKDHASLQTLDGLMSDLFQKLERDQDEDGFWGTKTSSDEERVYNTDRALAACYVYYTDDALINSKTISKAHKYLLGISSANDGVILDVKGSINTLESFQKLFDFGIRDIVPNELWSLASRLEHYGLMDDVVTATKGDVNTLKGVRASARIRLEEQGVNALEILGVNYRLFESLKKEKEFLQEFTRDRNRRVRSKEKDQITSELMRFLSATLTETRSASSRRLIKLLWQTDGFLNFIPLIQHLSDLERDGAFYKYYRDHLNHEVLLFLLGTYIYQECATFRNRVNDEIKEIYDSKDIEVKDKDLLGEFLFRWKLISTFHDIGYLFEVDPVVDKSVRTHRTKEELLVNSFGVVDDFRAKFLQEYFDPYIKPSSVAGMTEREVETARQREVRELADEIAKLLSPYPGVIKKKKDLFKLTTPVGANRNAFNLISQYLRPPINQNLVKDYFRLCDSTPVMRVEDGKPVLKREPFLDHGIMSALVLLKAADIQRYYLDQLRGKAFSGALENAKQLRSILAHRRTEASLQPDQFFIRFSHVAGAIALHNISPHLYSQKQCAEVDAAQHTKLEKAFHQPLGEPDRYIISLDRTPLAYLTALADTLQDWDRHSFRRLSFADEDPGDPISSSEVIIEADDNRIRVRPLTAQARKNYQSLTQPEAMDQYLEGWSNYVEICDTD